MSFAEVEILRKRAEAFLKYAEEAFIDEEFDFVCSASEQAAQLFMKSVMLKLIGEIPRTHRDREMLALLNNSIKEAREAISEFVKNNRDRLRALDEAYVTSRYLSHRFEREDAEELLGISKEVFKLDRRIIEECQR